MSAAELRGSAAGGSCLRRYAARNASLVLSYLVLAVMGLYYVSYALGHGQLSVFSVTSVFNNTMPLLIAAIGQTFVVLTGGIDLSVGSIISLTNSLAAVYMKDTLSSSLGWSGLILLVGSAAGAVNGLLVAVGRIQPILVTLASLSIWAGAALFVLPQPGGAIPPGFTAVLAGNAWNVVPASAVTLLVLIGFWMLFRRTGLAVALYAVGDDERSARANGVPVVAAKIAAYALSGLFAALAGLYLSAVTTSGDATTGAVYTLTSIAAVVLGGVSLFGGRGSAAGSMAGAFVLTLIVNILFFANINPLLQEFFQGLVLILAMAASVLVNLLLGRAG
ncbi:MAG TPA: ABC transporter permease [bacterium]|nr:ABC transporter permease [bacterium]